MSWSYGKRYSCPLQSLVVSPLISRIHSPLFSDRRRTDSSKFFDTQVTSISTEELVLPRHALCVLSRLRCNGHSLLLSSYRSTMGKKSRVFLAAPADSHPRAPPIPFCTVQLRTLCATHFLATLCLSTIYKALGSCPASRA